MMSASSTLSLLAAALYLVVAGAAIAAAVEAIRHRQITWHLIMWGIIAALFIGLALVRFYGLEEMLRGDLRMILYAERTYDERRSLQKPLFAIVFVIAASMVGGLVYFLAKRLRGRRNVAALVAVGCTGGLMFLAALRLVSLHSVDALLYGPVKINWFADLGMTIAVLACAIRYCLIVRRRQG